MYFDRNATQNAAKRSGSAGMDRRSNAAWVLPQAVKDPHGRPAQPEQPDDVEAPAHRADDTSIEAATGAPKTLSSRRWLGDLFRSDQPTGLNLSGGPAEARDPEPAPEPRQVAPAGPLSSDGAGKTPTRPAAPGDEPQADPPHRTAPHLATLRTWRRSGKSPARPKPAEPRFGTPSGSSPRSKRPSLSPALRRSTRSGPGGRLGTPSEGPVQSLEPPSEGAQSAARP